MQEGTCSCVPYFTVTLQKVKVYTSKLYDHIKKAHSTAELVLPQEIAICVDVGVNFYHQSIIGKERMFRFCFNTSFVDMHLLHQRSAHTNTVKFTYRKVETQSKQFAKTLKKAGENAGVDITTGVSVLFPQPHKITSTPAIILPRSMLDKANKDKKHYPDNFEV